MKDIITFTKGGFNELVQVYYASVNNYLDYIKVNGTISVSGNIMDFKVTGIGISSLDFNGMPTGTIVTYKEGSAQYDQLFVQADQPKLFYSEYFVIGNKLTTKTDNNHDGDCTDANETSVYIKQ